MPASGPIPRISDAWDEEAITAAARQAEEAAERDPDAAQFLLAQVVDTPMARTGSVYDPSSLYAQMLYVAHWTPSEIDATHYPTFFAMVRELSLIKERERDQYGNLERTYDYTPSHYGDMPENREPLL